MSAPRCQQTDPAPRPWRRRAAAPRARAGGIRHFLRLAKGLTLLVRDSWSSRQELLAAPGHRTARFRETITRDAGFGRWNEQGVTRLEAVQAQASDRPEIFHVPRHEGRVPAQGGGRNQGVGNRDRVTPSQVSREPRHARGNRHPGQELKQRDDVALLPWSQGGTCEQLTFRDDRDRGLEAPALHIMQETARHSITTQVIDQDVRIDEIPGHLRGLTLEAVLPFLTQAPLVRPAGGQASSQQSSGLSHDALGGWTVVTPADQRKGSDDPLNGLQIILQALDLVNRTRVFHEPFLLRWSLA